MNSFLKPDYYVEAAPFSLHQVCKKRMGINNLDNP